MDPEADHVLIPGEDYPMEDEEDYQPADQNEDDEEEDYQPADQDDEEDEAESGVEDGERPPARSFEAQTAITLRRLTRHQNEDRRRIQSLERIVLRMNRRVHPLEYQQNSFRYHIRVLTRELEDTQRRLRDAEDLLESQNYIMAREEEMANRASRLDREEARRRAAGTWLTLDGRDPTRPRV